MSNDGRALDDPESDNAGAKEGGHERESLRIRRVGRVFRGLSVPAVDVCTQTEWEGWILPRHACVLQTRMSSWGRRMRMKENNRTKFVHAHVA